MSAVAKQAIFIGDSILQYFTQDGAASRSSYFTSNYNCQNLAVPGDTTDQTIRRLTTDKILDDSRILPAAIPKVCTLLVGTNDIGRGRSVEYVAGQIGNIIRGRILQDQLGASTTDVLLIGIIPRGSLSHKPELTNQRIAEYGNWDRVTFLDVSKWFLSGSKLNGRLYWGDGLHLSSDGYEVLAQGVATVLGKLMV